MLTTIGFVIQQLATLPGVPHITDFNMVPQATDLKYMLQFIFEIGIIQFQINKSNVTIETDPDCIPNDFRFNLMGISKNKTSEQITRPTVGA